MDYLYSIIDYIENHISTNLKTEFLASIGFVSRRKLYYDFYNISGHSVKEYIRKRRLSMALALLKNSDMGLADIAYECGYSSQQALCRTLKRAMAITPIEYKNGDVYYFFPPFDGKPLQSVVVSEETIPNTLCIVYYQSNRTNIEDTAIHTFLREFPQYDGRIFGRNGKSEPNRFCYELYLTETGIDTERLKGNHFEIAHKNAGFSTMFATSTVINEASKINSAWDYIYAQWAQNSMFEYTNKPYFEEYILKKGKPVKVKLYLPIRERIEMTKITLLHNPELRFLTARASGNNAEETASRIIIDYVTAHYPNQIHTFHEFYLWKDTNEYVCGIKIHADLQIEDDENIMVLTTKHENYLVLESNVMGNYEKYVDMLQLFARDNGIDMVTREAFAVYNTEYSSLAPRINLYCPAKVCTKR